jgi:N-acyl-D-amino-acid deacylase
VEPGAGSLHAPTFGSNKKSVMLITPPAFTIDPPPLVIDPPPIDLTPPSFSVTPPAFTVTPPAIVVGGRSYSPPALTVQPPARTVSPPSVRVRPPSVTIDPPALTIQPPALAVPDPAPRSCVNIDPPPITVTPPPLDVHPPQCVLVPPPLTLPSTQLTVTPPAFRVGFLTLSPPPVSVTVPALTVTPPAITVDPPSIRVQPPSVTVDPPPLTVCGQPLQPVAPYAQFDRVLRDYLKKHHIPGAVLAVMKDRRLVLSRGYGWMGDRAHTRVLPTTPMRIASVVKTITRAALRKLETDGKLSFNGAKGLDIPAFRYLDVKPLPLQQADRRFYDITLQHLLDHRGGWDRTALPVLDPMFQTPMVSLATGHPPADAADVLRFMAGQPLQADPGKAHDQEPEATKYYSNFGYCVLGRVIEKASGKKYIDYVRDDLLAPLGIKSIELGRSLPADRNPSEPVYVCSEPPVANVVQPAMGLCPLSDGGFHLEALDSAGGLIASAPDLLRFAAAFEANGVAYNGVPMNWTATGSLPGTSALLRWRPDGVLLAAIFNHRPIAPRLTLTTGMPGIEDTAMAEFVAAIDAAVDSTSAWP